jgi:hypothetical protein
MDGILFVNVAVPERLKKMISKTQLQFLQSWNKPYIKTQWKYCEEFHKDDPLKWYIIYFEIHEPYVS